jgi:dipeptidase
MDAMKVLRAHGPVDEEGWRPDRAILGAEVCMHAGFGPVRISQTTGSLIVHLAHDLVTCWVTATAAPCTGIFKPLWLDGYRPWEEPKPRGVFDPACLWWRHELIHRSVLLDYPVRARRLCEARDRLEADFEKQVRECAADLVARQALANTCFQRAAVLEGQWLSEVGQVSSSSPAFYHRLAWEGFNRQAGLSLERSAVPLRD